MQYLGVIIDATSVTVTLTPDRRDNLLKHDLTVSTSYRHDSSQFPSSKVWTFALHTTCMEKSTAQKLSRGEFDQEVHLSQAGKGELMWWINDTQSASSDVCCSDLDIVISSDASS